MPSPRRFITFIVILFGVLLAPAPADAWGGNVHRLLNRAATRSLPPAFQGFSQWAADLERLSTAADERKCCVEGERIRHYIDIDDYPEFFTGTLPHPWSAAVATYGLSRVQSNGTGPWALTESYATLVDQFASGDWAGAVATAADIGHYAGDLHNPLHLTVNFDGQLTEQHGVHSRYESELMNRHLGEVEPTPGTAFYWSDPLESVFDWIDHQYPGVDLILSSDRAATATAGSTWSQNYYDLFWYEVGGETRQWVSQASLAIASLWYSAWVDAGSPRLPGSVPVSSATWGRIKAMYGDE